MPSTKQSIRIFSIAHLSLALASVTLTSCAHDQGMVADPAVVSDIKRCGVDIQMSSSLRLRISRDAQGGGLSGGTLNEVKSTIFTSVPPADRLAVYQSYADCVSSRAALENEVADVTQRKLKLVDEISRRYPEVTAEEVQQIKASYDKEASELRAGQLLQARSTRGQTVYAIVQIANRHHFDPGGLVTTYSYAPSGRAESTQEEHRRFMEVCLAAADKPLCENAVLQLSTLATQSTIVH